MRDPSQAMRDALIKVRSTYRLSDVLLDDKGVVYLVDKPAQLERLVGKHAGWSHERLLRGVFSHGTVGSYVENATYWDGLEGVVSSFIMHRMETEYDTWTVIPLPIPGWPRRQVWSARLDRIVRPNEKPVRPFDLCGAKPTRFGSPGGPVLLQLGEWSKHQDEAYGPVRAEGGWHEHPPLFMSHGVDLDDLKNVVRCGGLRWPSWAVTWRVPPTYGDVVFLGDVNVVKDLASGARRKGFYLAGTDIWSMAGRELDMLEKAVNLELRGDGAWWSGDVAREKGGWGQRGLQNDLLASTAGKDDWDSVVGAMSYSFGGDDTLTDQIKDRRRFVSILDGIIEDHVVDDDPYVYPPRPEWDGHGKNRYPYMELKVVGRVSLSDLPAVVYPVRARARVFAALDQLGFRGARIPYRWSGAWAAKTKHDDALRRRWAVTVTTAIVHWTERFGGVTELWPARRRW